MSATRRTCMTCFIVLLSFTIVIAPAIGTTAHWSVASWWDWSRSRIALASGIAVPWQGYERSLNQPPRVHRVHMIVEHLVGQSTSSLTLELDVERKRDPSCFLDEDTRYDTTRYTRFIPRALEELRTVVGAHHAAVRFDGGCPLHQVRRHCNIGIRDWYRTTRRRCFTHVGDGRCRDAITSFVAQSQIVDIDR